MKKDKSLKRPPTVEENDAEVKLDSSRKSDEPLPKKAKWLNKQRVLVFASRGITYRDRHLMKDIKTMLPHSRDENKIERKENLAVINEICEMKNCNKCILLEGRKKTDLYMWISNVPNGPSVKFLVENIYTMGELKLTGNCLKGSRPLLSFDENFDKDVHYSLLKELFVQVFGTPRNHPKSKPFTDRVVSFSIVDNRIWFRNYQILTEDGALTEIGPRFVLNPIKIFEGSFGGITLWQNPFYITPGKYRRQVRVEASNKYKNRVDQKAAYLRKKAKNVFSERTQDDIFQGDVLERAAEISQVLNKKDSNSGQTKKKKKLKVSNKSG